jgi:cupin superfamily acireductone dioxygenase involved in methionine salvage
MKKKYKGNLFDFIKKDSLQNHRLPDFITRSVAVDFPVHLALNKISKGRYIGHYVAPHKHKFDEINIILGNLEYKIGLGSEEYQVRGPKGIWIPRGVVHYANVLGGSGYFICMRLDNYARRKS